MRRFRPDLVVREVVRERAVEAVYLTRIRAGGALARFALRLHAGAALAVVDEALPRLLETRPLATNLAAPLLVQLARPEDALVPNPFAAAMPLSPTAPSPQPRFSVPTQPPAARLTRPPAAAADEDLTPGQITHAVRVGLSPFAIVLGQELEPRSVNLSLLQRLAGRVMRAVNDVAVGWQQEVAMTVFDLAMTIGAGRVDAAARATMRDVAPDADEQLADDQPTMKRPKPPQGPPKTPPVDPWGSGGTDGEEDVA